MSIMATRAGVSTVIPNQLNEVYTLIGNSLMGHKLCPKTMTAGGH